MSWILLSISAAFVYAIVSIFEKFFTDKYIKKPLIPGIFYSTIGLFAGLGLGAAQRISELSYPNIFLALLAGALYIVMLLLSFKAIKEDEISRIVPLFQLSSAFLAVFAALFLGEIFSTTKYIGIFLLVTGAILISLKKVTGFRFGKGFWYMMGVALCSAAISLLTKYLLGITDYTTVFLYNKMGAFLCVIPIAFHYIPDLKKMMQDYGKRSFLVISSAAVLEFCGSLLFTIATSEGPVTLVNAMTSIHPFFVLLLTVFLSIFKPSILKEEIGRSTVALKFAAIALIFAGAVLIT